MLKNSFGENAVAAMTAQPAQLQQSQQIANVPLPVPVPSKVHTESEQMEKESEGATPEDLHAQVSFRFFISSNALSFTQTFWHSFVVFLEIGLLF